MKKTFVYSVLLGAAVFAAGSVNAQNSISDKVTVTGVLTYQAANTVNGAGTITTLHTKSVSFNNKSIIALLNASAAFTTANAGNQAGAQIPASCWFTYDGSDIWVTNKAGYAANLTTLLDTNNLPFATISVTSGVANGQYYNDSAKGGGSEVDKDANIIVTIQDGKGTSLTIAGLGSETFKWTKADGSGNFKQSETLQVTGGGSASYQGNSQAIFKGSVNTAGNGTLNSGS